MPKVTTALKRILVGRPQRSDKLGDTLLPKRLALPVFASDALSSVAYAPEEIFVTLSIAGISAYSFSPWIGLAVVVVLLTVVTSYRQNVHAYPSGGGDYEVATVNLGRYAGLTVASALLVDYTLTVAVSISSAAANIGAVLPFVSDHKVTFSVAAIVVLTAMNLRGLRESGTAFAIPTYAFMFGIGVMVIWGFTRILIFGDPVHAASANLQLVGEGDHLTGFALVFLVLRSFTQGCAALTGVEAISNGVPAFKKPKSKNAATTLLLLGTIAVSLVMGMIALSIMTGIKVAEDPATQLHGAPPGYVQQTMVAQLADAVFGDFRAGFYFVVVFTALILVLAANTAFNGFPVLGSILAQDRYLPRQLHTRGDRLAFSNGIVFLAGCAVVLVVGFQAEVTRLIPLYTVGVFVSFTLSQTGMLRHWHRLLSTETDPAARRRMRRSQGINGFGLTMTGAVLILVLVTKFTQGAWIALAAMAGAFALMLAIHKHYSTVSAEIALGDEMPVLPARNHAIVLVSGLNRSTIRALGYARATRPDVLEAVTVNVDDKDTRGLTKSWEDREIPVPLKVIESPYREITRPVLEYVKRIRTDNPRDVVTVFIPEYVVGRWWEQLLHNQSALRLKGRLLFQPGVMVTSVPWQLESSERAKQRAISRNRRESAPGAVRRGYPGVPVGRSGRSGWLERPGRLHPHRSDRVHRPHRPRLDPAPMSRTESVPELAEPVSGAEPLAPLDPPVSWLDRVLDLEVGPVAHGGHCVARSDGRVVFVRHALPGERVRAVVTEDRHGSFCRADVLAVLVPSPDRVEAPCVWARAGGCGGCDYQHASPAAQRQLKTAVLAEQLHRLAGVDLADFGTEVEELPGGALGWRHRMRLAVGPDGQAGLRAHRAHDVIPIADCLLAPPGMLAPVLERAWAPGGEVQVELDADGEVHVSTGGGRDARRPVPRQVGERRWEVPPGAFWQVHPALADTLCAVVAEWAQAPAGGCAWDLYGGAGVLASVLAEQVGPEGSVTVVESDRDAVRCGAEALDDLPWVQWRVGRVERVLAELAEMWRPDVVVADPPRKGLGRAVVDQLAEVGPARLVHVACDPAALARDVALLADRGYRLDQLRAFDAFPMTHHLEAVALFLRD